MGVIVIGYIPKPEGRAALALGAQEAKARSRVVIYAAAICATDRDESWID